MKKDEITTILIKYIKKEFTRDSEVEIVAETDLFASGILDSLGLMKLIRFIEATFDNPVPLIDILPENFSSVRNISLYLTNA
ncbi:Phosphopantetheine attachment site [Robiginitalea myxolifaciens]|uniref:Phosphopantetheine attachment site n=1 Tax=Robiginitalea myxolifaciens TaxID=400055 RepID=A0A1I6FXU8_9FLAO|nr:acyl carrier protein [Robiginitalea myxolifaciens]SFR34758.1 Phosphopantetheine attachment site [Robiginitalea myxolifaciens]